MFDIYTILYNIRIFDMCIIFHNTGKVRRDLDNIWRGDCMYDIYIFDVYVMLYDISLFDVCIIFHNTGKVSRDLDNI